MGAPLPPCQSAVPWVQPPMTDQLPTMKKNAKAAAAGAPAIQDLLAYRLQKATHYVTKPAYLIYSRDFGITGVEWRLMGNLQASAGLSLAQVCQEADVPMAQGSRTIASLAERGLVARAPDEGDGRSVRLTLTPAGRSLFRKVLARSQALNAGLAGVLTSEELAALYRALDVLAESGRALLESERAKVP
jgi:DNA-binding MarR family transcriptional regulator